MVHAYYVTYGCHSTKMPSTSIVMLLVSRPSWCVYTHSNAYLYQYSTAVATSYV